MTDGEATIQRAQDFAAQAHGDQKYGDKPYTVHLRDAAREMEVIIQTANPVYFPPSHHNTLRCAVLLHDVLEDTDTHVDALRREFGATVADLVEAVTDEPGKNRKERKAKTYPKIRAAGPSAVAIKLADRIANVRAVLKEIAAGGAAKPATGLDGPTSKGSLLAMYRKEHSDFFSALHRTADGLEPAWEELRHLLAVEEHTP